MIPVDYVVNHKVYREFIHDISANGVFIGCKVPPATGDQVILTFAWKEHFKSSGTVVRADDHGFAVQFTKPITIH
jgi:PilZ domain